MTIYDHKESFSPTLGSGHIPEKLNYDELLRSNEELKNEVARLKKVEKILSESEKKYRDIFENVTDFLYFHDMQGTLIETNEHFKKAFGNPDGGLQIRDLIVDRFKYQFDGYLDQIQKNKSTEGLMKVETSDGRELILEYRNSVVFDEKGPIGVRGSARDITSHIQAEKMLKNSETQLKKLVVEKTREISLTQRTSIETLAKLAEYNDSDTGEHLERIQRYVRLIATQLRDDSPYSKYLIGKLDYIDDLELASILHDIGKVAIPMEILSKPARLTKEEFEQMKSHTTIAGEILDKANQHFVNQCKKDSYLALARDVAFYHHEKWNGTGYPEGLKGDEIPLSARIVAIADVYDALTSKRPYKDPWPHEDAVNEILKGSGSHFDAVIVTSFKVLSDQFFQVST